ncbi:hypothetical protein FJZ17_02630 [Candidatus Pacearchaeota archaeon]|nr:hypothetical protein [Candidatus Pacearchaeota archaeon]
MSHIEELNPKFKTPENEGERTDCIHRAKNKFNPMPGAPEVKEKYDICKNPGGYCPFRFSYGSTFHCLSDKQRQGKD